MMSQFHLAQKVAAGGGAEQAWQTLCMPTEYTCAQDIDECNASWIRLE